MCGAHLVRGLVEELLMGLDSPYLRVVVGLRVFVEGVLQPDHQRADLLGTWKCVCRTPKHTAYGIHQRT